MASNSRRRRHSATEPDENLKQMEFEPLDDVKIVSSFEEMGLKKDLLRGIYSYGFDKPSEIQQCAISLIMNERALVAQSQPGAGKTATFIIGALQRLDTKTRETQVLILAPTCELAIQIKEVILKIGDYMNVQCHACIGGTNIGEDIKKLDYGQHIVIGTVGRVFDMIRRGNLRTKYLKMVGFDEADELLSKGSKETIYDIYRYLPPGIQVVLLSTTLPDEVLKFTSKLMTNPVRVLVKHDELTLGGIKQFFIAVDCEEWKFDTLVDLYNTMTIAKAVVFCNTRRKIEWLAEKLREANFTVAIMHGEMEQAKRDYVMKNFSAGESRILITSDFLARGLNVPEVSLVVNYDLPDNREIYIHRIGFAGSYDRKGVAINFVKKEEIQFLRDIEQYHNTQINEMPINVSDLI